VRQTELKCRRTNSTLDRLATEQFPLVPSRRGTGLRAPRRCKFALLGWRFGEGTLIAVAETYVLRMLPGV
jgi:hypothetical protein